MIALSLSADRLQLLDFGAERFEFCFLSIDPSIRYDAVRVLGVEDGGWMERAGGGASFKKTPSEDRMKWPVFGGI